LIIISLRYKILNRSIKNGNIIDLSGLTNGIYFYSLNKQENEIILTGKILVEE